MIGSLEVLKKYREDLLLAEVAAWLHDYRKCSNEHIAVQAEPKPPLTQGLGKGFINSYLSNVPQISMFSHIVPFGDLIAKGNHGSVDDESQSWLVRAMRRCHKAAHIEKEETDNTGKQPHENTRPSSPFGFEGEPLSGLTEKLNNLPYEKINERPVFEEAVRFAFSSALGDTRRPINEVTLWDWAHIVAALYKAALAGALLQCQNQKNTALPDPNSLKWRLLALRFAGSQVVDRSPNIQAVLARRDWVNEGLDKAKRLLEEDYPLATEVYRDTNGSLFVVPDIEDLLEYTVTGGDTLQFLIKQELDSVFNGELVITPQFDQESWWAQDPNWSKTSNRDSKDEIPPIAKWLNKTGSANPCPAKLKEWWQNSNTEPCRISGMRPQGPNQKGVDRKLSDFWLERTGKRSEKWVKEALDRTIWIDELSDTNGRVALVAAKLDLKHWLTPGGLVNTLLATAPLQGKSPIKKNPSFARLRRIWKNCEEFWQKSIAKLTSDPIWTVGPRLVIEGNLSGKLGHYHTYEIPLKPGIEPGIDLEVVWDESGKRLIVITNLQYLAKRLGAKSDEYNTPQSSAEWLRRIHLQAGKELKIYEPNVHGSERKPAGTIRGIRISVAQHNYMPAISVLLEPQQFLVLVPADRALIVAHHIKTEYENQFSKVKNRLPLHLNLLFFGRKQPLYAVLDAARRMLQRDSQVYTSWVVEAAPPEAEETERRSNGYLGRQMVNLNLRRKAGEGQLPQINDQLETTVSYSTGDPNTEDEWYPYLFVPVAAPDAPLADRRLFFQAPFPGRDDNTTLVHIKEIKKGDEVCYAPSSFDFEFLDVTARRFELFYDEKTGMRIPKAQENYSTRPFLLEDLDAMQELWSIVAKDAPTKLNKAQLQQITGLIEAKRRDWQVFRPDDDVLNKFADQVLRRAFGKRWYEIPESQRARLISWIVSGRWRDLMELYASILKQLDSDVTISNESEGKK